MRGKRLHLPSARIPDERAFAGVRGKHRRAEITADTAKKHKLKLGSLVELHGKSPAPLRVWLYPAGSDVTDGCIAGGSVAISADGLSILGIAVGDSFLVRPLNSPHRVFT